jgi:hypothetical protein
MKKLFLNTLLICLLSGSAFAATIVGNVRDAATAIVLPGYKVYFRDSMSTYKDSAITDWHGDYTMTTPSSLPFNKLIIYTYMCGGTISDVRFDPYNNLNGAASFSICSNLSRNYTLKGSVTLNGVANSGPVKLYLIRKQYDPTVADTTLTAIDSTTTTTGSYSKVLSTYPGMPNTTLLLKAALQPSHSSYSSYVPTYYQASLVWSGAKELLGGAFTGDTTNVDLSAGVNTGGPGFIGGSVLLGANKGAAVGDPLAKRILVLTNSAGKPIAYTYSDAAGKFSFSNLATGTYKIFGDVWGKKNPPFGVTLSNTNPTVSNITFEENSTSFWGHFGGLSVPASHTLSNVSAYPNPVTNYLRFSGMDAIKGSKKVTVRDVRGAVISTSNIAAGERAEIPMADVAKGTYSIEVQTEAGSANFIIVK